MTANGRQSIHVSQLLTGFFTATEGYWRQRADETLDDPPPT